MLINLEISKMYRQKSKARGFMKLMLLITAVVSVVFTGAALAAVSAIPLSQIAGNVDTTVKNLAIVLSDLSLIAGVGFVMASFFKFHQHKLNPTQVPISQGITLLLIGAGLTLFPSLLPTATKAVFGSATISKTGGSQIKGLIVSGS